MDSYRTDHNDKDASREIVAILDAGAQYGKVSYARF